MRIKIAAYVFKSLMKYEKRINFPVQNFLNHTMQGDKKTNGKKKIQRSFRENARNVNKSKVS